MFMRKDSHLKHEIKPEPKQIKIPEDGQLSKKGTVIKDTKAGMEIDYSIADMVERINQAGFISRHSCSGLKKDHPLKDVNHDGAYISFFHKDNDLRALSFIRNAADRLRMTAEHCRIDNQKALVIRIDKDKAGNSLQDRIKKANEISGCSLMNGSMRVCGAFTKDLDTIRQLNGGLIYDSDEKLESVWKRFCNILIKASYQNAS